MRWRVIAKKCLNAGMDDYLSKPIDVSKLTACLAQWLEPKGTLGAEQSGLSAADAQQAVVALEAFRYDDFLALMMGDTALADTLLDMFVANMPGDIERLIAAIDSATNGGDCESVRSAAHFIKGAAANLCASTINTIAFEIERAGKKNDVQAAKALVESMQGAWLAFLAHPRVVVRLAADKLPAPGSSS